MEHETVYRFIHSFWVVWLLLVFVGIVAWAYWPTRRKKLEEHGKIPLRDDEDTEN